MSKFSIFSIFKHKIGDGINDLISTETKIKEIRRKYNEDTKEYIHFVEESFKSAKRLENRIAEISTKRNALKANYEALIRSGNDTDAKIEFIKYKSYENAYESLHAAQMKNDIELEKMKNNLEKIRINETMIDAKLLELHTQADAINYSMSSTGISFDCQSMIDELESEIKEKRWDVEAKREVQEIINPTRPCIDKTTSYEQEFAQEVARLRR